MEPTIHPDQNQEQERLTMILSLLQSRLDAARRESQQQMAGLTDTRRDEFTERQEPLLKNLWAAHRFEDLVHLSQEFQNAAEEEKDHESTLKRIHSLERMGQSPYFARIDLQFEEDEAPERVYIGRHSLWDDDKENLLVYDWRAPISSVFYRFGTGPAFYTAPAGKITCDLLLKRQFEIQQGRLIGYFDADTVIQDSFLRRLLAQNASAQMKAIVETLQRDQDAAIRDEDHDLMMVQGAAGSGKTSIAMHRAAYLMYEGLKNPLKAHNILVLSPNTVFEKYISGVLPELGESSVATSTLEQLLEDRLGRAVESRGERWEALCAGGGSYAGRRKKALAFKTSRAFISLLDRYAAALPSRLPWQDLQYAGRVLMTRQEMKAQAAEHGSAFPLSVRLRRMEDALWEQVHSLRKARMDALRMKAFRLGHGEEYARGCSIWESGVLARQLHALTRLDCVSLYYALLKDASFLRSLAKGLRFPADISCLQTEAPPQDAPLPLEDASAIAYLQAKLTFLSSSGDIRQVVVDEAQDYSPVDYAVLNLLYPKARFTVVGDIHQGLEKEGQMTLYEDIAGILRRKSSVLLELTKSFRCTREILNFSLRFLPGCHIDSLNRSGDAPRLLPSSQLLEEISACREKGYQSIALITKTLQEAYFWREKMKDALALPILGRHASLGEVFLAPLSLSKGLEFDAVLILDCDEAHYSAPEGQRLLYVACTRALHSLALFSHGAFTPLLEKEEGENA